MLYLEFRQRLITSLQILSNCQMIETFYHGVEDDVRVFQKNAWEPPNINEINIHFGGGNQRILKCIQF